jgi:hypothetical protein
MFCECQASSEDVARLAEAVRRLNVCEQWANRDRAIIADLLAQGVRLPAECVYQVDGYQIRIPIPLDAAGQDQQTLVEINTR